MAKTFEQRVAERIKKMKLDFWQKRKAEFKERRAVIVSNYIQQCTALKNEENELTWQMLKGQELRPDQLKKLEIDIGLEMHAEGMLESQKQKL